MARELGNEIIEWENPIGSSIEEEGFISLGIQFDEFLTRTINSKGLELSDDQEVIPNIANSSAGMIVLIEDFPNTFAKGSKALMNFRDSVLRYLVASTPPPGSQSSNSTITPIVMTVTETHITSSTNHSDSFTVGKLLGPQILQHLGVTVIEFNSVAPTLLSKAITTVIRKDNRRNSTSWSLGTGLIKKLSQSGDIRSSINSLQLTHLFDRVPSEDCQPTRSANKIISKSQSSAGPKQKSPVIDFRDSIVDLFHAVGKILYNKRKEANTETPVQPAAHLPHHTRPRASEVSIDSLHEEITSDIDTFISTLHENYPLSCYGVDFTDSLDDCITHFSDADLILSSSNNNNTPSTRTLGKQPPSALQSDYAFQITSRGLLFSLPHPIERGKTLAAVSKLGRDPFKMVYPAALRLWRLIEDNETIIDAWNEKLSQQELMGECTRISRSDIVTQLVPYASKISIPDPVSAGAKGRGKANHGYGFVDAEEELQTNSVPLLSVLTLPLPPAIASTAVANNERKNVVQSGSLAMLPLKEQSLVLSEDDIEDD